MFQQNNGGTMTEIQPRFFDSDNKIMALLEWEAIRILHMGAEKGDSKFMEMEDKYPKHNQRYGYWVDNFNLKSTEQHRICLRKINKREFNSLEEFYSEANKILKPVPKGKMLKDKKKRTAQKAYQQERLGDAFIDNPQLIASAYKLAFTAVEEALSSETLMERITQLVFEHGSHNITKEQIDTLYTFIHSQMNKHNALDRVEAAIIDTDDKNLVFMWSKIKRKYPKDSTFAWPTEEARKEAKCSKSDVAPIMKRLEKLGAIVLIQAGNRGRSSGRAAI